MGLINVNFLRKCYEILKIFLMFDIIEYIEDMEIMRKWMLLMMENCELGY